MDLCCNQAYKKLHPPQQQRSKVSWTRKGFVLACRERYRWVDFVFNGIDGFIRHKTGRHAALLAHYGFLSVFPMVVVLTTILGYALENYPNLQTRIVDSALTNVPIIGETLGPG